MAKTAAEIRLANVYAVMRVLRLHPDGVSRQELAEVTGLSLATVSTVCTQLSGLGLLAEVGRVKASVGRPTTRLTLDPGRGIVLGVDIAETYVHVETFDSALVRQSRTDTPIDLHERAPEQVVERVRESILAEVAKHAGRTILGVGVSAPGQVDRAGGTSVFAHNWDWRGVPLLQMLSDVVPAPLHLDNPLKANAIAELWRTPERVNETVVTLNLGTGVGVGIVLEGTLLRGATNSAGEWGHTTIVADGRVCRCGSRGCVEAYVGAAGIIQTLRELSPDSTLLRGDAQTATIDALADGLRRGEPEAEKVLETVGHQLGVAMASLVNMINPDTVVVGGWVSQHLGRPLLERAISHFRTHALPTPAAAVRFEAIGATENTVSLGVSILALEGFVGEASETAVQQAPAT